jgi:hypothetical protein
MTARNVLVLGIAYAGRRAVFDLNILPKLNPYKALAEHSGGILSRWTYGILEIGSGGSS